MKRQSLISLCAAALVAAAGLSVPALAQHKTAKQCEEEWTANKAAIQSAGKKKKDFMAECRGNPANSPSPGATQAPSAAGAPRSGATTPPPANRAQIGTPAAAGQFASEAQAKAHCPGDTVVWANLESKVYHFSGNRSYGNTKKGAYMCERDTTAAGFRAAKNEKHP